MKKTNRLFPAGTILKYFILSLASAAVIFPLYFLAISALKTDNEIFLRPFELPVVWQFQNITEVLIKNKFYTYMGNSFVIAILSVTLTSVVSIMAAYAITRMHWKGSGTVNMLLMTGIMIPIHAVILPLYLTVRRIGLKEPKLVLVCVFAAFALPRTIFIISGFLKDIPRALEEAAVIDGAKMGTVIGRIIVPLLKPAIATVCIFDFLTVWNDLLVSMIFISKDKDRTLQLGIMRFMGEFSTMYNYIFVAVLISIIPTLLIFIFFQKRIVAGITAGAVKG